MSKVLRALPAITPFLAIALLATGSWYVRDTPQVKDALKLLKPPVYTS